MTSSGDGERKPITLSGATLIPVSKLVAVVAFAVGAAVWAERIDNRLARIEESVRDGGSRFIERWRVEAFVRTLKQMNPALSVPDMLGG